MTNDNDISTEAINFNSSLLSWDPMLSVEDQKEIVSSLPHLIQPHHNTMLWVIPNYQEVKQLFQNIAKTHGSIDGLINGVGTLQIKEFHLLSQEEMQETINSNLMSIIYCCKCAQIKKGGHIINISSSSYSKGRKDYPIYSASKAAVVNFTQGLAEARPDLCINVIVPQRTNTSLRRTHFPLEDKNSLLQPEEIADKISSLLKSSSCTGSILEVRKKYSFKPKTTEKIDS